MRTENETELQYRQLTIQKRGIDEKKRVAKMVLASETSVERFGAWEVLSCQPGDVDMTRLKSGAPLLVNHDTNDQVGVFEDAWLEAGKLMGRARFGDSPRAQEI